MKFNKMLLIITGTVMATNASAMKSISFNTGHESCTPDIFGKTVCATDNVPNSLSNNTPETNRGNIDTSKITLNNSKFSTNIKKNGPKQEHIKINTDFKSSDQKQIVLNYNNKEQIKCSTPGSKSTYPKKKYHNIMKDNRFEKPKVPYPTREWDDTKGNVSPKASEKEKLKSQKDLEAEKAKIFEEEKKLETPKFENKKKQDCNSKENSKENNKNKTSEITCKQSQMLFVKQLAYDGVPELLPENTAAIRSVLEKCRNYKLDFGGVVIRCLFDKDYLENCIKADNLTVASYHALAIGVHHKQLSEAWEGFSWFTKYQHDERAIAYVSSCLQSAGFYVFLGKHVVKAEQTRQVPQNTKETSSKNCKNECEELLFKLCIANLGKPAHYTLYLDEIDDDIETNEKVIKKNGIKYIHDKLIDLIEQDGRQTENITFLIHTVVLNNKNKNENKLDLTEQSISLSKAQKALALEAYNTSVHKFWPLALSYYKCVKQQTSKEKFLHLLLANVSGINRLGLKVILGIRPHGEDSYRLGFNIVNDNGSESNIKFDEEPKPQQANSNLVTCTKTESNEDIDDSIDEYIDDRSDESDDKHNDEGGDKSSDECGEKDDQ